MDIYDEIRELLDLLEQEPIEELLKKISDEPIPFIDFEPISRPRRSRKKK